MKLNKKTAEVVVDTVTSIYEQDLSIAEQLKGIADTMKKNKVLFKDVVSTVAGLFADWPVFAEDNKRSKKGDVISLTTIKTKDEHKAFKKTKTYKIMNCFERNFRRYYEGNAAGNIVTKQAAKKSTTVPALQSIHEGMSKQLKRLAKEAKKNTDLTEVVESIELTLVTLADMIEND